MGCYASKPTTTAIGGGEKVTTDKMDELSTSNRITSTTPFFSPEVLNDGINDILPNVNPTDEAIRSSTGVVHFPFPYFSPYYPRKLFCPESNAKKE
jgi:hypothetical protein